MLFTSFAFLLFFPTVCVLYYLIPYCYRWVFLLLTSYYFYINWQPVYTLLLVATTGITYVCAQGIAREGVSGKAKKQLLALGCVVPLAFLFIFKYYNFLNGTVFAALDSVGLRWPLPELKLLLPIGISFYTFMAVGYLIDVYRGVVKAERNFGLYALFIAFFPQVTSGPIGRATALLPQLKKPEHLCHYNVMEGLKQMVWGYFMKLCVADRLAIYVDVAYGNFEHHNGTTLLLASFFYSIQIYCDFAGYSLIAIGAARIMGIQLMENFRRPYFAHNIKEFWSRWHISLSTWFRDYIYIPLGGNRVSQFRYMSNLLITFLVSGLWHGTSWTFIVWGGLHGLFQIVENFWRKFVSVRMQDKLRMSGFGQILLTFVIVNFAWIFFRAPDIETAVSIIGRIFTSSGMPFVDFPVFSMGLLSLSLLFIKEVQDELGRGIRLLHSRCWLISHLSVVAMVVFILLFGVFDGGQFIYFQF